MGQYKFIQYFASKCAELNFLQSYIFKATRDNSANTILKYEY